MEVTANMSFAGEHIDMHEGQTKMVDARMGAELVRLGFARVKGVIHGAANAVADATAPVETNAMAVAPRTRRRKAKKNQD